MMVRCIRKSQFKKIARVLRKRQFGDGSMIAIFDGRFLFSQMALEYCLLPDAFYKYMSYIG